MSVPFTSIPDLQRATLHFLADAQGFIDRRGEEWTLEHNVPFETLNHLIRVWVQERQVVDHCRLLIQLAGIQHEDGGWGDRRDEEVSRCRATAFTTQMLLRANRSLGNKKIQSAVARGLNYITSHQHPDSSWRDVAWHYWDATSVSVGTLLFASKSGYATPEQRQALRRGMEFIHRGQNADGAWYSDSHSSPVPTTAHLLQKCIIYGSPPEKILLAIDLLLQLQGPDGAWDRDDVDHTCDAIRCLMLASSTDRAKPFRCRVEDASHTAMAWLLSNVKEGGLGSNAWVRPTVLFTCDAIDTVLKYRIFHGLLEGTMAGCYQ